MVKHGEPVVEFLCYGRDVNSGRMGIDTRSNGYECQFHGEPRFEIRSHGCDVSSGPMVVGTRSHCVECRYMVNLCLREYGYNGGTW